MIELSTWQIPIPIVRIVIEKPMQDSNHNKKKVAWTERRMAIYLLFMVRKHMLYGGLWVRTFPNNDPESKKIIPVCNFPERNRTIIILCAILLKTREQFLFVIFIKATEKV